MNSQNPLVSIIIRTKNEERWISSCLQSVFNQTHKNIEVIIVDNLSTDMTVKKAKEFSVKIITIKEFLPGKSINDGIKASKGKYIVCLSGHCVPTNENWLSNLINDLKNEEVAGVYGRQQPFSYSSDLDKRDLLTVFGLDKKIQKKDSFFHNANSAFRREIWNKFPFDEKVSNIEDRVWGQQVIDSNYNIIYEPEASVFHWHGIHHDSNLTRASNVVNVLESIKGLVSYPKNESLDKMNITAIIPIKGESFFVNNKTLVEHTVNSIKKSKYVKEIIVSTDNPNTSKLAKKIGAKAPFLRPPELSKNYVDILDVVRFTLDQIEKNNQSPELVVVLQEGYFFRNSNLIDQMIEKLINEELDTIIAAVEENRGIIVQEEESTHIVNEGFVPKKLKKSKSFIGLVGLGLVSRPMPLRNNSLGSGKFGFYEINDPLVSYEIKDATSLEIVKNLTNLENEKY
ncbi:MAG: glycosyl transferase family 2 [Pelagibacteraceae bacterium]|nr:glycosyl transferase family 2 [Pelagibacteraceae bacterium]|tara:strand:+ start:1094 stop:2461 length:1368 start_codon:yes stop_codon:yes gene_type:complete